MKKLQIQRYYEIMKKALIDVSYSNCAVWIVLNHLNIFNGDNLRQYFRCSRILMYVIYYGIDIPAHNKVLYHTNATIMNGNVDVNISSRHTKYQI